MTRSINFSSSISDIYLALREGKTTASTLCDEIQKNYDVGDNSLQAYKTWRPHQIRADAIAADSAFSSGHDLGVLQGMPISVKDLYGVPNYPTFAGSPRELPQKWQVAGPLVAELHAQLAVITGKTHTVEFAFGGVGTNPHWPTPINPWDAHERRVPGGSSAGAGVSLMAGTAVVAVGSDTAGSVRCPAAFSGTVGLKTTHGRWSQEGIVPLSPSLDTAGILTRTAHDAAFTFAALDPLVSLHPAQFAQMASECAPADFTALTCDWFYEDSSSGIAEAVRGAILTLEKAGLMIVSTQVPEIEEAHGLFVRGGLAAPEFAAFMSHEMVDYRETLDPNVASRFSAMESVSAVDYLHRRERIDALARSIEAPFASADIIIGPTVPIAPPIVSSLDDPVAYRAANMAILRNTAPANILKLCAITIPVALDENALPVGLQIIAPAGDEEVAIAAACAFERVLGTATEMFGIAPRVSWIG
jgi:aspartyl-tRNA(Asn)/glutamyl-tRNA(Gln) amidotransferase subunit A